MRQGIPHTGGGGQGGQVSTVPAGVGGSGIVLVRLKGSQSSTILSFHYGTHDNFYGDGSVEAAQAAGRFFSNSSAVNDPAGYGAVSITGVDVNGQTTYSWTLPSWATSVDVLVVGGGGGGGYDNGGGGGAGGVALATDVSSLSSPVSIKVGRGGIVPTSGTAIDNGVGSEFADIVVHGGGGGGTWHTSDTPAGGSGGGGSGHASEYKIGGEVLPIIGVLSLSGGTAEFALRTALSADMGRLDATSDANLYVEAQEGGTNRGVVFRNGQGQNVAQVDGAGNVLCRSVVARVEVSSLSDARLKHNVQTIEGALERVCGMRGVTFDMDGKRHAGFIAQEMREVVPELVTEGEDGYLRLAYGNTVAVLAEALKEERRTREEEGKRLEAMIAEQREIIARLAQVVGRS